MTAEPPRMTLEDLKEFFGALTMVERAELIVGALAQTDIMPYIRAAVGGDQMSEPMLQYYSGVFREVITYTLGLLATEKAKNPQSLFDTIGARLEQKEVVGEERRD